VCTGSLVLGAAGLLKGKRATSHWSVVDTLARFGATPVRERVVRDGDLITGAGVSAGMDFGVTLVAELLGRQAAEAGVLMAEYAPEPPFTTGSVESAPAELVALLKHGLSSFVAQAESLAA
jgi:transcriptional regulator GlxA family with amidase domain